jgi:dTDP-4-amino-4,6-dideoxygalactose transaminase
MRINVKKYIEKYFAGKDVLFTYSGRSAIQAMIEDFDLKNSKIIIPSFICSNVFVPLFLQNDIFPVLVDCPKNSFNIAFKDIKKVYSKEKNKKKIKSLLLVHTYGEVNKDIEKIAKWCKQKNILLIEDCAHSIGISFKGKKIGTFGDVAVLSLWKIFRLPLGGGYVRNKGKIRIKAKKYKINNLDLNKLIRMIPFHRKIIDFLKYFKANEKVTIEPTKIEVMATPKIFDFLTISENRANIKNRRNFAKMLHSKLKKEMPNCVPDINFNNNYFHSVPLMVKNRDPIWLDLLSKNLHVGKMWDNPLSKDPLLRKKWKNLNKTPNTDKILSEKIVNLMVDSPLRNPKKIAKRARIIIDSVKKHNGC